MSDLHDMEWAELVTLARKQRDEIERLRDALQEIASMPYASDGWQIAKEALKGEDNE
jgi:low affinity Fe/Cu permease